jgi:hypothetical protein
MQRDDTLVVLSPQLSTRRFPMLSSFSPYVLQGSMPQFSGQFSGLPAAGFSPLVPGLPGQPGAYGVQAPFAQVNPYAHLNPYMQGSFTAHNPFVNSGGPASYAGAYTPVAQQIVPLLAQLAQQISIQSAATQQLGITLQQLSQQLAAVSVQSQQTLGIGAAQGFAPGAPFPGIGQSAPQNPFAGATQGGYGGFNPQAQTWWGGNRPQTIQ